MTRHTILLISKYEYIHPRFTVLGHDRYILYGTFSTLLKSSILKEAGTKNIRAFPHILGDPSLYVIVYDMIGRWYEPHRDTDKEQAQT